MRLACTLPRYKTGGETGNVGYLAVLGIADILSLHVAGARGKNPETGRDVREVRYRLRDNYTRFYLKYIQPKSEAIREGMFR